MPSDAPRVWITRAQPGASATGERVARLGLVPLVHPLLETRPLGEGALDLSGLAAVAFTSANAVRACSARGVRGAPPLAFAVGEATAAAAREAGFAEVVSAKGDVAALARLILATRGAGRLSGPILHLSAEAPAGDLTGALTAGGLDARRLDLYRTDPVTLDAAAWAGVETVRAVLLHSPRGGEFLAQALIGRPAFRPALIGLSAAVLAPVAALGLPTFAAAAPTETDLLDTLARWAREI